MMKPMASGIVYYEHNTNGLHHFEWARDATETNFLDQLEQIELDYFELASIPDYLAVQYYYRFEVYLEPMKSGTVIILEDHSTFRDLFAVPNNQEELWVTFEYLLDLTAAALRESEKLHKKMRIAGEWLFQLSNASIHTPDDDRYLSWTRKQERCQEQLQQFLQGEHNNIGKVIREFYPRFQINRWDENNNGVEVFRQRLNAILQEGPRLLDQNNRELFSFSEVTTANLQGIIQLPGIGLTTLSRILNVLIPGAFQPYANSVHKFLLYLTDDQNETHDDPINLYEFYLSNLQRMINNANRALNPNVNHRTVAFYLQYSFDIYKLL